MKGSMILYLLIVCSVWAEKEKKPRYTYHTEVRADGTVYHYAIDHSPEAQARIDSQFAPPHKPDTKCLGY